MKILYHLILMCFMKISDFDFVNNFINISENCHVEKRPKGVRMQMYAFNLS